MPFQFTCPHCFKKTIVEDKYAGQTGPCACCGKIVTLPELDYSPRPNLRSTRTVYVAEQLKSPLGCELPAEGSESRVAQQDIWGDAQTPQGETIPANVQAISIGAQVASVQASSSSASIVSPNVHPNVAAAATSAVQKPIATVKPVSPANTQAYKKKRIWLTLITVVGIVGIIAGSWSSIQYLRNTSVIQNLQDRRNHMMSLNNIGKIARALNAYAAQYGTYPPAVVYDDNGKPKHSWRVLILPQLGEYSIYNLYNFDEPWNSPRNSNLFTRCPACYRSPSVGGSATTSEANYFLLTGPGTVFANVPGQPCLAQRDVTDGLDSTFLVVECANPILEWTQPVDCDANGTGTIKLGGCYSDGTAAAKADGTAIWVPLNTSPEIIKAFTSPNGGEQGINPNYFQP